MCDVKQCCTTDKCYGNCIPLLDTVFSFFRTLKEVTITWGIKDNLKVKVDIVVIIFLKGDTEIDRLFYNPRVTYGDSWSGNSNEEARKKACDIMRQKPIDNIDIMIQPQCPNLILKCKYPPPGTKIKIVGNPFLPLELQNGWTLGGKPGEEDIYKTIFIKPRNLISSEDRSADAKGEKKSPRKAGVGKSRKKTSPKKSPISGRVKITCSSKLSDIRASPAFKNLKLKGKWKSRKGGKWRLRKDEVCEVLQLPS